MKSKPVGTFEKIFNRRVRLARERLRLSQGQLANRANMPAGMISHYECSMLPTAHNLVRLADALEVTTDWLLGRTHESWLSERSERESRGY